LVVSSFSFVGSVGSDVNRSPFLVKNGKEETKQKHQKWIIGKMKRKKNRRGLFLNQISGKEQTGRFLFEWISSSG